MPAVLRIGVRMQDGFLAHSWVEMDGQPVNDTADVGERFTPFGGYLTGRTA